MSDRLQFLTRRPVAHRGFHDASAGRIENTLSAVEAAVERGFSIEVDLQPTADGDVVVFHDDTLDRLTTARGPILAHTARDLKAIPFKATSDRIPTLVELLELVNGKSTLVIEIKGFFNRQHHAFVARILDQIKDYDGPFVLMSFDPYVVATLRESAPQIPRGLIAYDFSHADDVNAISWRLRFLMRHLMHSGTARPDFIAYGIDSLPAFAPATARNLLGVPLLTWTVRTPKQRARAAIHADQMIFEGFDPDQ